LIFAFWQISDLLFFRKRYLIKRSFFLINSLKGILFYLFEWFLRKNIGLDYHCNFLFTIFLLLLFISSFFFIILSFQKNVKKTLKLLYFLTSLLQYQIVFTLSPPLYFGKIWNFACIKKDSNCRREIKLMIKTNACLLYLFNFYISGNALSIRST